MLHAYPGYSRETCLTPNHDAHNDAQNLWISLNCCCYCITYKRLAQGTWFDPNTKSLNEIEIFCRGFFFITFLFYRFPVLWLYISRSAQCLSGWWGERRPAYRRRARWHWCWREIVDDAVDVSREPSLSLLIDGISRRRGAPAASKVLQTNNLGGDIFQEITQLMTSHPGVL